MGTETPSPQDMLPLTPVVLHMLLALVDGEKHGYGIMKAVEEDTQGQMQIRVGSLYGSIQRMIDANLIEETEERPVPELDDERRRYYRLTDFGRRVLQAETRRLTNVVGLAQRKHVLDQML
jgi:DNA-binding PadR family transcriptional regulator